MKLAVTYQLIKLVKPSVGASENLCHVDDVMDLSFHCLWKVCLKLALPSLAEALQTVLVYAKDILEEVYLSS